ncbi:ABC transporter substrate-binding protein [Aneurinibacillus sp. Ricciae_BoGa-3]|uniref:ABC transporter substrate-binding protein n=1 Tax=Aneurinibacillus sp. Ricciae_BoGa-3 TaxID=3022697 RepID=UPI00234012C4|nr:ABC transporter substrate-binding protein [Aneurinibacillus sp. Ricciae_BoGa-3]WCK52950.1 ABC transporter substrate-binding protein [Aneurinibacillus sp. Ricciae_BoGa-3]
MKRKWVWLSFILLILTGIVVTGCSQNSMTNENSKAATGNLLDGKWGEVQVQAKGQTVNMYMWGGSDSINRYIDEWAAPRLQREAGVTLKRIPVNDTKDIINKLLVEKQAGKKRGSMDIIWINGENFKAAKDNSLLWGSFANKLPNVQKYVDVNAPDISNDFGLATNGLEAPWGKAQFVFAYDSNRVKNPPKSMKELLEWAKQNPGKFTYPAPPDFTGSAFIRQVLYEQTGGYKQYLKNVDQKTLDENSKPTWDYLNQLKPYLWREGKTYPESEAKLDQLYSSGEIWMTMGYDPAKATNQIQKGNFPKSTRTFVLDKGTLSNTHYLSIPFNSVHQAGAMVAINFLLSPEAQIAKFDPANWGEDMSLNPKKLSAQDQKRLASINRGVATLPAGVLASHRVPEMPSQYVGILEKGWIENVAKK